MPEPPAPWVEGPYRTTNGLAWASLLMSLLWGFGILSFIAILFGHEALRQCRRRGQDGAGIATVGLIFGYLGILPAVFLLVAGLGGGLT